MEFILKIEDFEGPLNLLLYLIDKDEMDIYNIKIHKITHDYIQYIENMGKIDMDVAAEFIVMASILLEIKSKMLLPDSKLEPFDFTNEDDPRFELITKLLEYKKYKELSKKIKQSEIESEATFTESTNLFIDQTDFENEYKNMQYDIKILEKAFRKMLSSLKRFDEEKLNYFISIRKERYTLESKVFELIELFKDSKEIEFDSLFKTAKIFEEFITIFLALLEVMKNGKVKVIQSKQFSKILLVSGDKI